MALYEEFERRPNRLIDAQSPYLRNAAYQPIGWYEFGPEAFDEAKRQDKPILLDIGAVWCHWCHVIDRESYENPEIATLINELYIPIKVDRDERPDIDTRYQTAVQLLSGQGGWPLTVFLTPDGEPFFGGTYFPTEDTASLVGMKSLLPRAAEAYRNRRHEIKEVADALTERARRSDIHAAGNEAVSEETFQRIAHGVRQRFNPNDGGFELGAPKFPHAGAIEVALLQYDRTGESVWRTIAVRTLTAMGRGGIFDQLEGGFHRYATDAQWVVPHFEKMSLDNAMLLENYVHAARATDDAFLREVAGGTLDFIMQILADQDRGGFYSSQDADNSMHDDGSYWTWTVAEFARALAPDQMPIMTRYYGVSPDGDLPQSDRNVLHIVETAEEMAASLNRQVDEVRARIDRGKEKLLQTRRRRKAPYVDTSKYTNGNALLVSACLEAGALLGRDDARDVALRTIDVMLQDAYEPEHGMYHAFHTAAGARVPGLLEDQVYMAQALLDAFAATGTRAYLDTARHLLDLCIAQYWDEQGGGFFDMARFRQETVALPFMAHPRKVIEDMPAPAANAIAAMALGRLWVLTRDERYHTCAGRTLEAFGAHAPAYGPYAGYYGLAVFYHVNPPVTVTIIGNTDSEAVHALRDTALATYRPGRVVAIFPADAPNLSFPVPPVGQAVAYICAGQTCSAPVTDADELHRVMREFGRVA